VRSGGRYGKIRCNGRHFKYNEIRKIKTVLNALE